METMPCDWPLHSWQVAASCIGGQGGEGDLEGERKKGIRGLNHRSSVLSWGAGFYSTEFSSYKIMIDLFWLLLRERTSFSLITEARDILAFESQSKCQG